MTAQITTLVCGSASAAINHFGAQVFSWKVADKEQLFLSAWADHESLKPLRGGIPVCFPWFGGAATPFHGFARNHQWQQVSSSDCEVTFKFTFTAEEFPTVTEFMQAGWITLTFTLTETALTLRAQIGNNGAEPAPVELGFHGYFAANAKDANLTGVRGEYLDYASGAPQQAFTEQDLAPVPVPVNRVYEGTGEAHLNHLSIRPQGFTHTVVWNPGENPGMADMPDEQALDFVCVEQLFRNPQHVLNPGETLNLEVAFTAL